MMLKQRIAAGLIMATAITALTAASAFAADKPAVDAGKQAAFTIKLSDSAVLDEGQKPVNKADENGDRFFEMADGPRIYIGQFKGGEADGNMLVTLAPADTKDGAVKHQLEPKTDEDGNQYVETEDGSRIYVARSNSADAA